jgi:hypothetical protein
MVNAQEIQWQKDRPLTWKDFQGTPDDNSTYSAVTSSQIKYSYSYVRKDTVYQLAFRVQNIFNMQSSWSKKGQRNKDVLHHEQLHFDINEFFARKLWVALNAATYTRNFREETHAIFEKILAEDRDFQTKYDNQTIHSREYGFQFIWEQVIHKDLDELPRNY